MKTFQTLSVLLVLVLALAAGCEPKNGVVVYQSGPASAPQRPAPQPQPAPLPPPVPQYLSETPPPAAPAPQPEYQPQPPPPLPESAQAPLPEADVEVLTRGPVHEAYAEPVDLNAEAGLTVTLAPPPLIEEQVPQERPVGLAASWIPGYWAWDDDRSNYIWVSGIWRVPPPNCTWVPGYWTRVQGGWQWTPGFWLTGRTEDIVYLPAPPLSPEAGPIGQAPNADCGWIPGCWSWQSGRYNWQPGFWTLARPDWVWVPAHLVWTPRGYVFVAGHWDYLIERRGCLFAPVFFHHTRPGFYYSPSVIITGNVFSSGLFARPRYDHYYFGDYYDARYATVGIYPWFASRERHGWYDPLYEHESWQHRRDARSWDERERAAFEQRRTDPTVRPLHTFAAQQAELRSHPDVARQRGLVAQSLSEALANKNAPLRFEKVNPQAREQFKVQTQDIRKFGEQRAQWESTTTARPGSGTLGVNRPTQPGPKTRNDTTPPPAVNKGNGVTPSVPTERGHKEIMLPPPSAKDRHDTTPPPPTVKVDPTVKDRHDNTQPPAVNRGRDVTPPTPPAQTERDHKEIMLPPAAAKDRHDTTPPPTVKVDPPVKDRHDNTQPPVVNKGRNVTPPTPPVPPPAPPVKTERDHKEVITPPPAAKERHDTTPPPVNVDPPARERHDTTPPPTTNVAPDPARGAAPDVESSREDKKPGRGSGDSRH